MNTNPDINRLSMEDRIEVLEGRTLRGGEHAKASTTTLLLFDPKIVDQCKNNAITDITTGWIVKIDIPDIFNLPIANQPSSSRQFGHMGIKAVAFLPRMAGGLFSRASWLCRLSGSPEYARNANPVQLSLRFDARDFFVALDPLIYPPYKTNPLRVDILQSSSVWFSQPNTATLTPQLWSNDFSIYMDVDPDPARTVIYIKSATTGSGTVGSAFTFGASPSVLPWLDPTSATPKNIIGKAPSVFTTSGHIAKDLQREPMPTGLQPLYPTSWYS